MKKLMFVAAAALCGSLFADAITSANIVGYVTKDVEANTWYMIGNGFDGVGGESLTAQNWMKGMAYDWDVENCAQIQVFDGEKLVPYYYQQTDEIEEVPVCAWVDGEQTEADFDVIPGFSCWFISPVAGTITVSGQVVGTEVAPVELVANEWKMVANPYPIALTSFNDSKVLCDELPYGWELEECAQIQWFDGEKLVPYYYQQTDEVDEVPVCAWVDVEQTEASFPVPAQTGWWMIAPADGKIKFAK